MTLPTPRIIAHVVSERAKKDPDKVWGAIPRSLTDVTQGYEDISFSRLNYAVSRAAEWMQQTIGPQRCMEHEALAYIGEPDARYIILAIAAMKVEFQMLFLSPRNSHEAQRTVIEQAKCTKFLYTQSMATRVEKIIQAEITLASMARFEVPSQGELLKDEKIDDFPYERTVEDVRPLPLVSLHTSSTTGMPKIVRLTQGYAFHEDIVQHVPEHNGLDIITRKPFYGPNRMFVAMPLFHTGGILLTLLKSIYHDIVCVFQPSMAPLDARMFDGILRYGQCTGCVIPPYLLEEMIAVPAYFDNLASLKFVQFGSGPLSKAAGDLLLTRRKDCPHYIGSSECGLYIMLELDDPIADWQYFRFHPLSGVEMRPISGSDNSSDSNAAFELVVVRSQDQQKNPGLQPAFELFPSITEWPTNDLYVKQPSKAGHWRYIGRNDDVLVLSNGEKLNPVDIEARIANAHGSITGALVIGQGQFAPGLLLEVRDDSASEASGRAKLIELIWPAIQAANRESPGHGQLSKGLIIFTSREKPFLRTPKLSVRRGPSVDLYAQEIAEMYDRYDGEHDGSTTSTNVDFSSWLGVRAFLVDIIRGITEWDGEIVDDEDLFQNGMDSLQVLRIAQTVNREMKKHEARAEFNVRVLYAHPTLKELTEVVLDRVLKATLGGSQGHRAGSKAGHEKLIDDFVREYATFTPRPPAPGSSGLAHGNLNHHEATRTSMASNKRNILLTGSTGSLGTYILLALLKDDHVGDIYCVNRSKNAKERQLGAIEAQGVRPSNFTEFDDRVHFIHSESLAEPRLGIADEEIYEKLRKISHVIHNAWPVNFNLSLPSFGSHLKGVRALVDFANTLPSPAKVIFISSLSSVTSLGLASISPVPERIVRDASAPAKMGYGESKHVAEQILNNAAEACEGALEASIVRVGQIAGPVKQSKATWPIREWLPSLVISSRLIGTVPETLGRMSSVDWVPVDLVADCVVDLIDDQLQNQTSKRPHERGAHVFHLTNPQSTPWNTFVSSVAGQIGARRTVPLAEWIDLVNEGPDETADSNSNPAKKILPFYKALLAAEGGGDDGPAQLTSVKTSKYETSRMAEASETFRKLEPITVGQMSKWISKWI